MKNIAFAILSTGLYAAEVYTYQVTGKHDLVALFVSFIAAIATFIV